MGCYCSQPFEEPLTHVGPLDVWNGRRSPVYSSKGVCSSTQPIASAIGAKVLSHGGNAADAAVAMAAALNVLEPCSTGIGGDAFVLYYEAKTKEVHCLQGNGASSANISLDMLKKRGIGIGPGLSPLPFRSGLCVTVPGAPALWEDVIVKFGRRSLRDALEPAITLAREGFPVSAVTAEQWQHTNTVLQNYEANRVFKPWGRYPKAGEIFKNPDLATTFETIAKHGVRKGFYSGRIGEAIVQAVKDYDGVLDLEDLAHHSTAEEKPISRVFRGYRVYETPPPTHGLAVLVALGILERICPDPASMIDGRANELETHKMIECMRLAFADALHYVCDPRHNFMPIDELLSDRYLSERAKLVGGKAGLVDKGDSLPYANSDTVYFCCVDEEGITPTGTGFTLQNRGYNFSLDPTHPNALAPRKRPYHTIIPGLITREYDKSLFAVFGNMGGFMQPQGHFQLVRNLIDFKMTPQAAVDARRWYIAGAGKTQSASDVNKSIIQLEDGYGNVHDAHGAAGAALDRGEKMEKALKARGHALLPTARGFEREIFGRAQVIVRNTATGVLCAGSDPRADGCATPTPY